MSSILSLKTGVLLAAAFALGVGLGRAPSSTAIAADEKKHVVDLVVDEDPEIAKSVAKERDAALRADPKALAREQLEVAREAVEARYKEHLAGRGRSLDLVLQSGQRLLQVELALAQNDQERLACFERMWKLAFAVELVNKARFDAGRVPIQDLSEAKFARIEAQQRWLQAKAAADKKK